jgi:hypothetical protein
MQHERPTACAGSGGNITIRFVNKNGQVSPMSVIGAFPGKSAGGAGGDVNCFGGEQSKDPEYLSLKVDIEWPGTKSSAAVRSASLPQSVAC